MFSSAQCRPLAAIAVCFLLTAQGISQDNITLGDSKEVLNTLPLEMTSVFEFKIPPRPAGHVLDNAHFLTAESLESLNRNLSEEATAHGVHIYLLITPSVQKNTLDPFTQRVAEAWTKGLFGATLVFDDATGRVSIQQSAEVTKRFYEFELSQLLRDTMSSAKRPRLSREGLEYTTINLKNALHELKMRADHEDRNSFRTRAVLGVVGVLAALLLLFEYVYRRPSRIARMEKGAQDIA